MTTQPDFPKPKPIGAASGWPSAGACDAVSLTPTICVLGSSLWPWKTKIFYLRTRVGSLAIGEAADIVDGISEFSLGG